MESGEFKNVHPFNVHVSPLLISDVFAQCTMMLIMTGQSGIVIAAHHSRHLGVKSLILSLVGRVTRKSFGSETVAMSRESRKNASGHCTQLEREKGFCLFISLGSVLFL